MIKLNNTPTKIATPDINLSATLLKSTLNTNDNIEIISGIKSTVRKKRPFFFFLNTLKPASKILLI